MISKTIKAAAILVAVAALVLAPPAGADPERNDSCTTKVIDNAHVLSASDLKKINDVVVSFDKNTGADMYIRLDKKYAPDYVDAGFTESRNDKWFSEAVSKCLNWEAPDGLTSGVPKKNLVVILIGTDQSKSLIGYGADFANHAESMQSLRMKVMKPSLIDEDYVKSFTDAAAALEAPGEGDDVWQTLITILIALSVGAALISYPWDWLRAKKPAQGTVNATPTATRVVQESAYVDKPVTAKPQKKSNKEIRREIAARIAEVRKVLNQLDMEWIEYETDPTAYFLQKPVLRDMNVTVVRKYHDGMFELREAVDSLSYKSSEFKIEKVEKLAESVLESWSAANDYALKVGVNDMSMSERAALRRIFGLVNQLADPATPRAMWDSLKDGIEREMGKLVTVPVTWNKIAEFPAIMSSGTVQLAINGRG